MQNRSKSALVISNNYLQGRTMHKKILLFVTIILFMMTLSTTALARGIYDDEVSELAGTLRGLMIRAEKTRMPDSNTYMNIKNDLFELTKKLHRLSEEALTANLKLMETGRKPDRYLLLTVAMCEYLSLADFLTSSYLDTGDKVFWNAAVQAAKSARELQAK
jgi:hypothetical protein